MKILLDTNAYTAFQRGIPSVVEYVQRADQVVLSVVVAGELIFGFRNGSRYDENAHRLDRFLDKPSVQLLDVTRRTADLFGEISATLRKSGTPIPANDIRIAAQARETHATLVSSDRHFRNVDGIEVLTFSIG